MKMSVVECKPGQPLTVRNQLTGEILYTLPDIIVSVSDRKATPKQPKKTVAIDMTLQKHKCFHDQQQRPSEHEQLEQESVLPHDAHIFDEAVSLVTNIKREREDDDVEEEEKLRLAQHKLNEAEQQRQLDIQLEQFQKFHKLFQQFLMQNDTNTEERPSEIPPYPYTEYMDFMSSHQKQYFLNLYKYFCNDLPCKQEFGDGASVAGMTPIPMPFQFTEEFTRKFYN